MMFMMRWYSQQAFAATCILTIILSSPSLVSRRRRISNSILHKNRGVSRMSSSSLSTCPSPFTYDPDTHRLRHYHQHKAGGKTVNYILERIRRLHNGTSTSDTAVPLFSRASGGEIHGNRKALHKHIRKGNATDRYVTFLREPTAKVMSRFYYHRTMCNGTSWLVPSYKLAGVCCLTLSQYVQERAMNNNQYESLVAGMPMGRGCSRANPDGVFEKDWERIRRERLTPDDVCPDGGRDGFVQRIQEILLELSDVVFFAIVERWDESLFLFGADGGFDPSSVVYCHKNAKASGSPKPAELERRVWGAQGKHTLETLREYNALDLAVYEAATRLFDHKVACWEASRRVTVASETKRWQRDALVPFQKEHCGMKQLVRNYNAPLLGVPDGKLADPNYSIPPDLRIMISQEEGNRTCPQLLQDFSDCPFTNFLEPC